MHGPAVLVNGILHSYVASEADADALCATLRAMRREGVIPLDATVCRSPCSSAVVVNTDGGCLMRPLFVASMLTSVPRLLRDDRAASSPFDHLFRAGAIEYIDKQEEEHYVCIQCHRYFDEIYFCRDGGVDVGDVDAKARRMRIPKPRNPGHLDGIEGGGRRVSDIFN